MTTTNALGREPASSHRAVSAHRFGSVSRAGGRKAASSNRPKERAQRGRNCPTIEPHGEQQDVLSRVHFKSPACRNVATKSRSTPEKSFSTIEGRATSTRS